jgi:hypothetical protein
VAAPADQAMAMDAAMAAVTNLSFIKIPVKLVNCGDTLLTG